MRTILGAGKSCTSRLHHASLSTTRVLHDARLKELGKVITTDFASVKQHYEIPKYPLVLAHGLFGFEELHLLGKSMPGFQYWRGIKEALAARNIETIITSVPPSGSIEARAAQLAKSIEHKAGGKSVNIVAHSMGGLDSRYMISNLKPPNVKVMSLTTIASPHRGSAFADYMLDTIGPRHVKRVYRAMERVGLESEAFAQLTRRYMQEEFNPKTPDLESVQYYSYGASLEPTYWSIFRPSFNIIKELEQAPNDGLVSVPSSQWGDYMGTIEGVSHLDLINWTSRFKWWLRELTIGIHHFDAVALYLHIAGRTVTDSLKQAFAKIH